MAEDKEQQTEAPSGKKLAEAREKGQVASSRELTTFAMFAASTTCFLFILPWSVRPLLHLMRNLIEQPERIAIDNSIALQSLMMRMAFAAGMTLMVPFALLVITAIGASVGQTGLMWTTSKLAPNFGVLNPLGGFKRIFAVKPLIEFLRGLAKIIIVGAIGFSVITPIVLHAQLLVGMQPKAIMVTIAQNFQHLMTAVLTMILAIGALDYFYQRWQLNKSLRMSKQEVKDEHKQQEGDPHIKGHFRKIRNTRARRRMLAAVPTASVIITNPTHFSVALRYDGSAMGAPKVVAKGVDFLAKRIREVATENDIPIVENPPLARTLYATVEVDDEIAPEQYKAVAEIIGYVMRLKKGGVRRH